MNKIQLRKIMQDKRAKMAKEQVDTASHVIFLLLQKILAEREFRSIFCYESCKNEVQTKEILSFFHNLSKIVCVPVVSKQDMRCAYWRPNKETTTNSYQITEPKNPGFFTRKIDVAIVPGLAFTKNGIRLGHGGGYYDKWLSAHENVYKIGLCYSWQLVESLPEEAHDVKMDIVLHENMNISLI